MNLSNVARRVLAAAWMLIVPIHAFGQWKYLTRWTASENPLARPEGGRANSVAVHPTNRSEMFVASDSGGLFKTIDGGLHWTHVDKLPVIFTQTVVYVNATTLLVSAKADYKIENGGGVWRSTDGGDNWTQTLKLPGVDERLSAYEISLLGENSPVAVGTSRGVYVSVDRGETWTDYADVFGGARKTVYSVLLGSGVPYRIYAGGPSGVRLGTFPFSTWDAPATGPGTSAIADIHAFGSSTLTDQAYVVNGNRELFRTENRGVDWIRIPSAPPGQSSCDGSSFIRTVAQIGQNFQYLELYFGNRCGLHRLRVPFDATSANYNGTWANATIDHGDTRDLGLFHGLPVLLASTGGVHDTVPNNANTGLIWTLVGGGRGGFNALQINEMKGQVVEDGSPATDLYIGTQDNHLFAATVNGTIHKTEPFPRGHGLFIEALPRVSPASAQITFQKCAPGCFRFLSNQHWAADPPPAWQDAPNDRNAGPVVLRPCRYVQNVNDSAQIPAGLASTINCGDTWRSFAAFNVEPRGRARLGRAGDSTVPAIVYQPFRNPAIAEPYASGLMRIRKPSTEDATVLFPSMFGFGGLGFLPTQGTHYQIFGVDPTNSSHLIAPDVVGRRMKRTTSGGRNWVDMPQLTDQVTGGGVERLFRTEILGPGWIAPIVTAVSFHPDGDLVLVGTVEGGIFFSSNNGDSWGKISGTEKITYVTSFVWESRNMVHVSTYGRGLWTLRNRPVVVGVGIEDFCDRCDVVSQDGSPGVPSADASILAIGGSLLGVRTEKRLLREVFVTPGTSVVFTGDPDDPQDDIAVTESDGKDTSSFEPLPKGPDGWLPVGVVFMSDDELVGTAYADSELSLSLPQSNDDFDDSTESPAKGLPYLHLASTELDPDEDLDLSGTDFIAGATYELLIDGEPVKGGEITADGNGSFQMRMAAPARGRHTVEIRLAGDDPVIDGTLILVR